MDSDMGVRVLAKIYTGCLELNLKCEAHLKKKAV